MFVGAVADNFLMPYSFICFFYVSLSDSICNYRV